MLCIMGGRRIARRVYIRNGHDNTEKIGTSPGANTARI